jgi:hypothetical protein
VSIGTGTFTEKSGNSMGWAKLVNQLIASATSSEDTHNSVQNFLSPSVYYRFNPELESRINIDEKDKKQLSVLKEFGRGCVSDFASSDPKRFEELIRKISD